MTRRQAREQAFILMFEHSFQPELDIDQMIQNAAEARLLEPDAFAVSLVCQAESHTDELDEQITRNLIGWRKERISRVSSAILRLAICEILFMEEIPVNVSINEAVELSKCYATQEDSSFINGVLGSVAKKLEA